ncbi:MAG: hypothetical protein LAO22_03885 [Acidobacteriia bacterium]|nr:hypothetical protein [Terriglobia bacterium]
MRRTLAVAILALFVGTACAAFAAETARHQIVLRKYVVTDQQGLGGEVFHLLVPKEWRFSGGVSWNTNKIPPEVIIAYTITSPDGRSVIEQFPATYMFWSQNAMLQQGHMQMGFTILQPMGAADFLKNTYLRYRRPNASDVRVVDSQNLEELAKYSLQVNQYMDNVFAQISPPQFPYELRSDAAHVKFEYTEGGRKFVEDFTAVVDYLIITTSSLYGPVQSVDWTPVVSSFRAPAEDFDRNITAYKIVVASRQDNPRWGVEHVRLLATVTREQLRQQEAIFQRMQQIHKTLTEIDDMIYEGYQRRSAAYDHMFDNYIQGLRGVDTYRDPVNNYRVEIPVGYENAWTNGTDYVFSDSPSFDPNVSSNQNWHKMKREQR